MRSAHSQSHAHRFPKSISVVIDAMTVVSTCNMQEVLPDANHELRSYLSYPLEETLASEAAKEVVDDDFGQVAQAAVQAYESGALQEALQEGPDGFKVRAAQSRVQLPSFGIVFTVSLHHAAVSSHVCCFRNGLRALERTRSGRASGCLCPCASRSRCGCCQYTGTAKRSGPAVLSFNMQRCTDVTFP
jgi:hypothetical protein